MRSMQAVALFLFGLCAVLADDADACYRYSYPTTDVTYICVANKTSQNKWDGNADSGLWVRTTAKCLATDYPILPGKCGCPNDCFASFQRGTCQANACVCKKGWKGKDCSTVSCEGGASPCMNGGKCVRKGSESICECAAGYHLSDCSAKIKPLTPFPQTIPYKQYKKDKFEDKHPILDVSQVTQIRVKVSQKDLESIITGSKGNEVKMDSLLMFNGNMQSFQLNATIARSGHISVGFAKKSFRIRFEDELHGLKSIKLKGAQFDSSFVREAATIAIARSMGIPVYRMGYSALYINDIFRGLYVMLEDMKKPLLKSRFGNSDGTLCKITECEPESEKYYELRSLCSAWGTPNVTAIEAIFDTQMYLKSVAVDSLTGNFDGWIVTNNYVLYEDTATKKIIPFRQDLDGSMGFLWPLAKRGVVPWLEETQFCSPIHSLPQYKKAYLGYVKQIAQLIKPGGAVSLLVNELRTMLLPFAVQDLWHQLDYDFTPQRFVDSLLKDVASPTQSMAVLNFLNERYSDAIKATQGM